MAVAEPGRSGSDDPRPTARQRGGGGRARRRALTGKVSGMGAGTSHEPSKDAQRSSAGGGSAADAPSEPARAGGSRRFPSVTRDTARPEGGGRAAPRDASAPARQWPLLSVLVAVGLGLLIVATEPFGQAFRIGLIIIGAALMAGAALRWTLPSVGMLAVRSRFTDITTYGVLGVAIVLLSLMAQPRPWLNVPFLEDAVHFTVR
ncbi:DUF3017 domain-containing protein [Streptomyces sp. NPDC007172]|uniref:DUF3017 domain-containing protein n=1 Tax=unclassified Streptomyces TaxID=2593676 RepID=UPI00369C754F